MAKTAIPQATRGTLFLVDPALCTIVDADETHPLYDPSAKHRLPDAGMIASVEELGVITPILLRPDGDRYEVIAGRRRVRAAIAVNATRTNGERIKIPAIIRRGDDGDLVAAVIVENLQREDLTPSQQASAFGHAMRFGLDEGTLARKIGVSPAVVRNRLKLLDVRAEVRDAVDAGRIGQDVALQLAQLPRADQDAALAAAQEHGMAGPQARKLVRGLRQGKSPADAVEGARTARRGMRRDAIEAWVASLGRLTSEPRTAATPSGIILATLQAVLGESDLPKWLTSTMPAPDAGEAE